MVFYEKSDLLYLVKRLREIERKSFIDTVNSSMANSLHKGYNNALDDMHYYLMKGAWIHLPVEIKKEV